MSAGKPDPRLVLCVAGHKNGKGTEALDAAPEEFRKNKPKIVNHTLFSILSGKVKSAETVEEDLEGLTSFFLTNQTDLQSPLDVTPLASLVNLTQLVLKTNFSNIDLKPLVGLVNLKKLDLSLNTITDLSGLECMEKLQELYLNQNQIVDVNPLAGLANLVDLELSSNPKLKDVTALAAKVALKKLSLAHTAVADLAPLEESVSLNKLELTMGGHTEAGKITDLSPLVAMVDLRELLLDDNRIVNLQPLSGLVNLEQLSLADNMIVDVAPLAGLVKLRLLAVSGNEIATMAPLAELRKGGATIYEDKRSSICSLL